MESDEQAGAISLLSAGNAEAILGRMTVTEGWRRAGRR
jgi:hypothetical protein